MAYGETYEEFVEKFKPKLTTDDCYTPPAVFEAVYTRIRELYPLTTCLKLIRPFNPGDDYKAYDYTDGVVIDNPPFSILSQIVRYYKEKSIPFVLFAPTLTCLSYANHGLTIINIKTPIKYENGALVKTSFITNLDPDFVVRQDDRLEALIKDALHITYDKPKRPQMIRDKNHYTNTDLIREHLSIPRSDYVAFHRKNSAGKQYFGGAIEVCPQLSNPD